MCARRGSGRGAAAFRRCEGRRWCCRRGLSRRSFFGPVRRSRALRGPGDRGGGTRSPRGPRHGLRRKELLDADDARWIADGWAALGCTASAAAPPGTSAAGGVAAASGAAAREDATKGEEAKRVAVAAAPTEPAEPSAAAAEAPSSRPEPRPSGNQGVWIGAAGASDFVLPGRRETQLGVWIDVPAARAARGQQRAPAAVVLLVDASGSMQGPKMENARAAAQAFVDRLPGRRPRLGRVVRRHRAGARLADRARPVDAPRGGARHRRARP